MMLKYKSLIQIDFYKLINFMMQLVKPFKSISTFCLILLSFNLSAQDSIVVKGQFINNKRFAVVVMKKFDAGEIPIGKAIIKNDNFSLTIPKNIEKGIYRFQYSMSENEQYLDIIINGIDSLIEFKLLANIPSALPQFIVSDENRIWYEYLDQNLNQLERLRILNDFINKYPKQNAAVVNAAESEWEKEKSLYWQNFNSFKNQMTGTWAYEMVVNRPYYFSNPKDEFRIQDFEKKENFWEGFNATNPSLINTPLYTEHILNYLRYWMNPNMNFSSEEKTNGFKRSVDVIMRNFSGNEKTKAFAFKYLSSGFKEIGNEEVLQYLDENYKDLANQCYDNFEKTEFEKRMMGYATLKPGNMAPNFELNLLSAKDGIICKKTNLYKLQSKQTMLIFWSSTCPHCMEKMPVVNEWAAKHKDVQIIAISLDINKADHLKAINQFSNLKHSCDYKGWDTEAAKLYYIVATPTIIMLNEEKKILGKFADFDKLILEQKE